MSAKNAHEAEIDEVLPAMLSLLDAQYRTGEARQAKQRELGFQREYNEAFRFSFRPKKPLRARGGAFC